MKDKRPAIQFYVKDWLADDELHACSLAAQGLWMDMLCHMYNSEERGYLISGGKPWSDERILWSCRSSDSLEVKKLALEELRSLGVARIDERGITYNKRMAHDWRLHQIRSEAGKKGGAPVLVNQIGYPKSKQTVADEDEVCISSLKGDARGEQFDPLKDDFATLVPKDWDGLLRDFLKCAYLGSSHLQRAGALIHQYTEPVVRESVVICIENNVASWAYLQTVCAGGGKRLGQPKGPKKTASQRAKELLGECPS